jgi:hypothetical protein
MPRHVALNDPEVEADQTLFERQNKSHSVATYVIVVDRQRFGEVDINDLHRRHCWEHGNEPFLEAFGKRHPRFANRHDH